MKEKALAGISLALFLALTVSLFFNYKQYRDAQDTPAVRTETVIEWRETATERPQATEEREVGKLSVPVVKSGSRPRNEALADSVENENNLDLPDTIMAELPLTQKVYEDSTFTAYVSGYQPNLDSIRIRWPTMTTTITQTKNVREFRRWNVGIIGGYGYGFNSRQFEPFVGIGVTYNLFK